MNLKDQLKAKLDARAALVKTAIDAGRAMSDDEQTQYSNLGKEIDSLENTIKAMEEQEKILNTPVTPVIPAEPKSNAKKWANFGEYLTAVKNASAPGGTIDNRLFKNASGMNENVSADGGFLVDQQFVNDLVVAAYDKSRIYSRTRNVPIGAGYNGLKMNLINETTRVDGSRGGGVLAYWAAEAATVTAKQPKFREFSLKLEKLMALCYATDELIQDATALQSIITEEFSNEIAFKLDDGCINGTGIGQMTGILNSGALVTVAAETGQGSATILYDNIIKMYSRMYAPSWNNAVWYINQDIIPQLFTMTINVGTGGAPVFLPASGASGQPYSTLLGRPVIPIEQSATLGTVGDIILADMSQYITIEKGGLQADSSIHVRFLYDENLFRFIYRANGLSKWNSTLTPFKGANTQSPFIALATR